MSFRTVSIIHYDDGMNTGAGKVLQEDIKLMKATYIRISYFKLTPRRFYF